VISQQRLPDGHAIVDVAASKEIRSVGSESRGDDLSRQMRAVVLDDVDDLYAHRFGQRFLPAADRRP